MAELESRTDPRVSFRMQPLLDDEGTREESLLTARNSELNEAVKARLEAKIEAVTAEQLPSPQDYFINRFYGQVTSILDSSGLDSTKTALGPPTQRTEATSGVDLAFNVAGMAKALGVNPINTAQALAAELRDTRDVDAAEVTGPFVNISLDFESAGKSILEEVAAAKDKYGHFREGEPELVVIDYSSPNVAKNMTLAHLRSTIIGHSLTKIQQAAGNIPFSINHVGDWGSQFGGIIYEYKKEMAERGDEFRAELDADPTATLMRIYRGFNTRKETDPEAETEAREIFLQLEKGDPELVELWSQFREWSLRDFGPSYERLRINFDAIQGESFYEDRMELVIDEALEEGVLRFNKENAVVFPSQPLTDPTTGTTNDKVMLDQSGNPRDEVILKPSGGTVYLTRDLAAIRYRGQELGADKILYVIGKEQQTHCLELFAMAHQLGYMALGAAEHVSFGHLNVDGRKMKSRSGRVVLLNEVLDEATEAASDLLTTRKREREDDSPLTGEESETARKIGVSSLIFNDLRQDRKKDIEFVPDMAKAVEAGGVTYVQYTSSRLASILEKVGEPVGQIEIPENLSDEEKLMLLEIARLPIVVEDAAAHNAPHRIATYLTAFCQTANIFYRERPVAKAASQAERDFRLHLVGASRQVIKNAADLLHIELPERM
jgi:arginyl-tRNA synthetase